MDLLKLQRTKRLCDSRSQTPREFDNFIFNEVDFRERFIPAGIHDHVTLLSSFNKDVTRDAVLMLLLEKPCNDLKNRVPLYVCAECGDIGCGALTINIEKRSKPLPMEIFHVRK